MYGARKAIPRRGRRAQEEAVNVYHEVSAPNMQFIPVLTSRMNAVSNTSELAMEITESRMENVRKVNAGYEDQVIALNSEITGLKNRKSTHFR
jgi:hypothetical protein